MIGADGLIAATPIFSASYSGLFKMFFDVIERDGLAGKPVLLAATGGTARHSLALDHALRPLFAYLGADDGADGRLRRLGGLGPGRRAADGTLVERIDRAARELSRAMAARADPVHRACTVRADAARPRGPAQAANRRPLEALPEEDEIRALVRHACVS